MAERLSLSGEAVSIDRIALHHADAADALGLFYSPASPTFTTRFAGYRRSEVDQELRDRLLELDRQTTLSLLTAVEAAFRVDYLRRCYGRRRDEASRRFRALYGRKGRRASFEDDILDVWRSSTLGSAGLIAELRGAMRFRHWMAHGRYWTPKFGRRYDYPYMYPLAVRVVNSFPLIDR